MLTSQLTAQQCEWLLTTEAADLLQRAATMTKEGIDVTKIVKDLRQRTSVEYTHLIISQNHLRQRAGKKFRLADQMFFTEQGLEQSTGDLLAGYKASRFADAQRICDLCVGIGGDAMAMAKASAFAKRSSDTSPKRIVTGVDLDEATATFARHNMELVGSASENVSTNVLVAEVGSIEADQYDAWHLDPDQRWTGKRSRDADSLSPGLVEIERLLSSNRNGCVKLSPMTEISPEWLRTNGPVELEFLGDRRECKQKLLRFGEDIQSNRVQATIVLAGNSHDGSTESDSTVVSLLQDVDEHQPYSLGDAGHQMREPRSGDFLYEPHATVIAAGLVDHIAQQHGLQPVESGVAYLCGARSVDDPMLADFRIVDVSSTDSKQIRRMLQKHDARIVEWKKRGVDHRLMESFKKLKAGGDVPHTLIVTRVAGQRRAILATRVG